MATISARVATVNVYGTFEGAPPYGTGLPSPTRAIFWATPVVMNFSASNTIFHPVSPGVRVGNTSNYIYSVVEVDPTGLNQHSQKYASNQSVTTLNTNSQL